MMSSTERTASGEARIKLMVARQRRIQVKRIAILAALSALLLSLFFIDLFIGPSGLSSSEVVAGLFNPGSLDRMNKVILFDVRLPASIMAALVGASLAVAGMEMQTVLDNPLASPFTLGVSSAAALGAAVAIVTGTSFPWLSADWLVPVNAFLFAMASVALLQLLTTLRGGGSESLVLFGIALVFSFNAGISLLQFYASAQSVQQIVFWMMGNLQRSSWGTIWFLGAVLVITLPFSFLAAPQLTAVRLGEERALSFGVDVRRLRILSLLRVTVLTATAVAFVGTIGFIGLVGPHIARMTVGEDHRFLIPASALCGSSLLIAASIASKLLVPNANLPVGVVAALVGVPVFIWLVLRQGQRR